MIIQKAELFKDLSPEIVNQISEIMIEESFRVPELKVSAGEETAVKPHKGTGLGWRRPCTIP